MVKKIAMLLLALALCLGMMLPASAEAAWETGLQVSGFTVTDVRSFDLVGAEVVTLTHDKTGALVMLLLNEDPNRTFDITFRTVAEDNSGTPHVFEHATLDGSRKYPSKELWFNLTSQTYNTYMNANTYRFMTSYPVASLSEEQLLKYADLYLDSCFNPMIYEDESIFAEEAWRYSMSSADADLTRTGTVYNEMLGSYTLQTAAAFNFYSTAFPGSTAGNVSGGMPSEIPSLTWQSVCDYHTKYYHPSNSLTCVYGKLENPQAFLELLNSVFSAYDAKDFSDVLADTGYTPLTEDTVAEYAYGVEAGSDTANGTEVYYGFLCEDASWDELLQMDLLTTLMDDDSSVFQQAMKDQLPNASASCFFDNSGPEIMIVFSATRINRDEAETFKTIVDDSMAAITENGFDRDAVEAVASAYSLATRLATESSSVGVNIIPSIAVNWALAGRLYGYMENIDALDNFVKWAEDGTYQALLTKYLNQDAITVISITSPEAGLKEAEEAATAQELAEIKAGMTEEEIAAIVEATNAEATPSANTADYVKQLTAVTVENLPEETRLYDITDETGENGVRSLYAQAAVDGVGSVMLRQDISGLPQEQILWMQLYCRLLGEMDTAQHTQAEIATLSTRYLYNGTMKIVMPKGEEENTYVPYFHCGFTALEDQLENSYALIREIVFETDFTNADALGKRITAEKTSCKQQITQSAYALELYRLMGKAGSPMAYYYYVNAVPYYEFLCTLENQMAEDPQAVIDGLNAIRGYLRSAGYGAIIGYVGTEAGRDANAAAAASYLAELGTEPIAKQTYDLYTVPKAEALIVDTNTTFNLAFATWEDLDGGSCTGDQRALAALVEDRYLLPLLRDANGAYAAAMVTNDFGVGLYSYRDPCVAETFQVYSQLGTLLENDRELDQTTLDGYIMSAYSAYALPAGELTGGMSTLVNLINQEPQEKKLESMKELKGFTPERLASYTGMLQKIMETGSYATVSSASVINSNAELFENVMNPFAVQDSTQTEIPDVTAERADYEVIRWVYENGVMALRDDGTFAPDESATLGDLAAAFYFAIGGNLDAEAGIATLSQYQVLPAQPAETVLTREEMVQYTANFIEALGNSIASSGMGEYADADQLSAGGEAAWAFCLENGLIVPDANGMLAPQQAATRSECALLLKVFFE